MSRKSNLAQICAIACTLSLLLASAAWAATVSVHVNVPVVHPKVPVVKGGHMFEIKDFSFGVENPTTIGSAPSGAGAGKIKFNEFNVKKPGTGSTGLRCNHC